MTLFLCGDVMTGRGIDQILPYPAGSALYEPWVRDARHYVELAEFAHGPIPRPATFQYIWGDALEEFDRFHPDARIVNLETSITTSEHPWPEKGIHYRMHPRNVGCLTAARIDYCCLANNHVMDWGYDGLEETLQTLADAGVRHGGAGRDLAHATAPSILEVPSKGRILLFAFGSTTSGIPPKWAATKNGPGVNLLTDLSEDSAVRVGKRIRQFRQADDVVVVSIHWGDNWGYAIPKEQVDFAHRLVEEGVAIVHGHSSHHVRAIEMYQDRVILYGCGDFLTDYEGIGGHGEFRGDLALMYFVSVDPSRCRPVELTLVPMRLRRCRLEHASAADAKWLCGLLDEQGMRFGTQACLDAGNRITIGPAIPQNRNRSARGR